MGVISDPAKVVGTTSCGRSVRYAIAFPNPVVDPPPADRMPSAFRERTASMAASVTSTGVCMAAPGIDDCRTVTDVARELRGERGLGRR